jgi:hypothetical protein
MQSDFSSKGRSARERIAVPEISMGLIRSRSHKATAQGRVRSLAVCGALVLATLGAGAALSGKIHDGINVWLSGGKVAIVVRSFEMAVEPTAADVRAGIAHASFPVVFPVGLPAGTRITGMEFSPSSVTVRYANRRANFHVGLSLIDTATIRTDDVRLPTGAMRGEVYQWQVGRETVVVPIRSISLREMNGIKTAMMTTDPENSLVTTEAMLPRIILLDRSTLVEGPSAFADVAEHYAPASGSSVLLALRQAGSSIAQLAKQGKPILDSRIVTLSNIPAARGKFPGPDYSKATLHWFRAVVVSAGGVRAIDAVLRSIGGKCDCEVLFNQPSGATYWVWTIPTSPSASVKKYSVDAKSLTVTPSD